MADIVWDDEKPSSSEIVWDDEKKTETRSTGEDVQRFLLGGSGKEPVGEALIRNVKDIPRQAGLATRYGIEGVGNTIDLVGAPIKYALQKIGLNDGRPTGSAIADVIGLPEPQSAAERVTGDISRILAGGGGMIGGARYLAAKAAPGVTQNVLKAIANRPDLQAASAIGAGAAGGATREAGGDAISQFLASLAGGLGVPLAMSGAQKAYSAASSLADRIGAPAADINMKIDALINQAVKPYVISINDIGASTRQQLRDDMQKAMQTGTLSQDVVRRLADYRMTGLTPTAGPLTLNPGIVTRQKNLSALGASSQDPKLQALSQIENANARKLIENVNELGAGTAEDALAAGQKVSATLAAKDIAARTKIGGLYEQARESSGRSALLDGKAFAQQVQISLKENLSDDFLPASIKKRISSIASGEEQLTVDTAEKIKTAIGKLQRGSADGNVRYALGLVRDSLENTPLVSDAGENAIKAFGAARAANREWMGTVERTPALAAIRDGVEPDKFVQTYITGSGNKASVNAVSKLHELIKDSPEAVTAVKNNIAQTLKKSALGGKPDELSRFSASNYSKMLNSIGDAKMSLFFSPQEMQALKAIGRVASYEQFQPTGSAVNNSKTAAAMIADVLDRIGGSFAMRISSFGTGGPVLRSVGNAIRNYGTGNEAIGMTQLPVSIMKKPPSDPMFLLPPALAPFLLQNEQ